MIATNSDGYHTWTEDEIVQFEQRHPIGTKARLAMANDGQWFHVYCFKEAGDAQKFMERFCGKKFDPIERGRGADWARWKKG